MDDRIHDRRPTDTALPRAERAALDPDDEPMDESESDSPELARRVAALRTSVTAHVGRRLAEGASVERAIAEARRVVRNADASPSSSGPSDSAMAQVVRWSTEAYYDQPVLQHVPRFY